MEGVRAAESRLGIPRYITTFLTIRQPKSPIRPEGSDVDRQGGASEGRPLFTDACNSPFWAAGALHCILVYSRAVVFGLVRQEDNDGPAQT